MVVQPLQSLFKSPDGLLGEVTHPSDSRLSETTDALVSPETGVFIYIAFSGQSGVVSKIGIFKGKRAEFSRRQMHTYTRGHEYGVPEYMSSM